MPNNIEDKIREETAEVVKEELKELRMTDRKRRFIREIVKNPTNPTLAAKLAGYSSHSAHWTARKLMQDQQVQTALAAHFLDHEEELTTLLSNSLIRLGGIVAKSKDQKFLKAFDRVMAYTKIATKVLGIMPQIGKKDQQKPTGPVDLQELKEAHAREIERIDQLLRGDEVAQARSGERTIQ